MERNKSMKVSWKERMFGHGFRFLSLAAVGALLLTVSAGEVSIASASPKNTSTVTNLSVGIIAPRLSSVPLYYAANLLKADHINVKFVPFQSDGAENIAFGSGAIDMAVNGLNDAATLAGQGVSLKMFTVSWNNLDWVFLANSSITSVAQLANVPVGISSPSSESDTLTKALFNKYKIPLSQLDEVAIGGTSARAAALLSGKIDASWIGIDSAYAVENTGSGVHQLAGLTVDKVIPNFVSEVWMAPTSYINSHATIVQDVTNANILANRWAQDQNGFAAFAGTISDGGINSESAATVDYSYGLYKTIGLFPINGGMNQAAFESVYKFDLATNAITSIPSFSSVATMAFQTKALEVLKRPSVSRVAGVAVPGKRVVMRVLGSNFYGKPKITSSAAGTKVILGKVRSGDLTLNVTSRAGTRKGVYTLTMRFAQGQVLKIKYNVS